MENYDPALKCFCLEVAHTIFAYISLARVSYMAMMNFKGAGGEENGNVGEHWECPL